MMLTKTKPDGSWSVIGVDGKIVPWKDIPKELVGALYKLHAYERSELNPETVETLSNANAQMVHENARLLAENNRLKSLVDTLEKTLKGSGNNG